LAREVDPSCQARGSVDVLDLGCGDAHLFRHLRERIGEGVVHACDMSAHELAKAARDNDAFVGKQLRLHQCHAAALPLVDDSVDVALSHMAFMLMVPRPVVHELRRVLRPGGVFAAVIDNPDAEPCPPIDEMRRHVHAALRNAFAGLRQVRDVAVRTRSGLQELFTEAGFTEVMGPRPLRLQGYLEPTGLWEQFRAKYFVSELPGSVTDELQALAMEIARRHANSDGLLRVEIPLQIFSAT
jgi:SAM-dependent methyltransferase